MIWDVNYLFDNLTSIYWLHWYNHIFDWYFDIIIFEHYCMERSKSLNWSHNVICVNRILSVCKYCKFHLIILTEAAKKYSHQKFNYEICPLPVVKALLKQHTLLPFYPVTETLEKKTKVVYSLSLFEKSCLFSSLAEAKFDIWWETK